MRKIIGVLCLIFCTIIICSCQGKDNVILDEKVVPVFQGISMSQETIVKRQLKGKNDLIPDDGIDSLVSYFASPSEILTIEIHLYNPDQFEILSLSFADKKYQAYEFKDGSTGDVIYIDFIAPANAGEYEYEITGIKYIDKQAIKDVDMSNGNKTISLGVTYTAVPLVNIYAENVTKTSYEAQVQIIDKENIIAQTTGLKAYLFDEYDNLIQTQIVNDKLEFINLQIGSEYYFTLAISFDFLDGHGSKTEVLYEGAFATLASIGFADVVVTETTLNYDIYQTDLEATLVSILLQSEGESLDITQQKEVVNLVANQEYLLVLTYQINAEEYTITKKIKTLAYEVPVISGLNVIADKNSISYESDIVDTNNLILEVAVYLIQDGITKQALSSLEGTFTSLLSKTVYSVELVCKYDLKDGAGIQEVSLIKTVETLSLSKPIVAINYVLEDNIFKGELSLIDTDNTFKFIRYELCDQDGVFIKEYQDISEITNLKRNTNYQLKLIYQYNLNDGIGDVLAEHILEFATTKQIPELTFNPYFISSDSFGIDIFETDPNVIGEIASIRLYNADGSFLEEIAVANSVIFSSLMPNTQYIVKIGYVYDLDDGNGTIEVKYEQEIKTAKVRPTVDVSLEIANDEVVVKPVIDDPHAAGILKEILLYQGDTLVYQGLDLTICNLWSDTDYLLEVVYEYNLEDMNGIKEIRVVNNFKTLAKVAPVITLNVQETSYRYIEFGYELIDNDQIFQFERAILSFNNQEVKTLTLEELVANDLFTNNRYTLTLYYSYDLNNQEGIVYDSVSIEAKTLTYDEVNLSYQNLMASETEIFFNYLIKDETGTLTIIKIELFSSQGELVATLSDLTDRKFTNLVKASFYNIVTTYTYDLHDGNGIYEDRATQEYGTTGSKLLIEEIVVLNDSVLTIGEEAHIRVNFANPNNLNVSAIYINNERFEITQHDIDSQFVVVKFTPDTLGGYYELVLTGYSFIVENGDSVIEITENLFSNYTLEIAILGDLGITYFGSSRDIPFAVINEYDVALRFDEKYQIESITTNNQRYNQEDIMYVAPGEVRIKISDYTQTILKAVTYSLVGTTNMTTEKTYTIYASLAIVENADVIVIDSPSDFTNMISNRVYEITCDLDFSSYNHQITDFSGVIIGNNHQIKNLSIVDASNRENVGLFGTFSGYINNLDFVSPYVISSGINTAHIGVLAGVGDQLIVENVNVINAYIETRAITGGLIGNALEVAINGSSVSGEIIGSSSVGGLIGNFGYGYNQITKVSNKATIKAQSDVGGIFGACQAELWLQETLNYGSVFAAERSVGGIAGLVTGKLYLYDALNYGNVSGPSIVGGILGEANTGVCYIENVLNLGSIEDEGKGILGHINVKAYLKNSVSIGAYDFCDSQSSEFLSNCYTSDSNFVTNWVHYVSLEQLNSREFWLDLNFNEERWNLENLDIGNNLYPNLKFAA